MRERERHCSPATPRVPDHCSFRYRELLAEAIQKIEQHAHAIVGERLVGSAKTDLVRHKNMEALSECGNGGGPVRRIATQTMQQNHVGAGAGLEIVNLLA